MNKKPNLLNYLLPLVMIFLGLKHYFKDGIDFLTILPIGLGIFSLYLALFNHDLWQRIMALVTRLWYPIGQVITVVLLTITFFCIFAPVGLILRLLKKDILDRVFKVERSSYWIDKPANEAKDYTQQF